MCIIAIKQAGTPVDWDILDTCDMNNPDGSGFAYVGDEGVVINKGYFGNTDLQKALESEGIDTTDTLIMFHFRIATHGAVKGGTCHPFPMSSDTKELTATHIVAPIAVSHNGVVPGMRRHKVMSDTMVFIQDFMAPLGEDITKPAVLNIISELACSKLAILTTDSLYTVGDFIEDDGWKFSNDSYKAPAYYTLPSGHVDTYGGYSYDPSTTTERVNWEWGYDDDDWETWLTKAQQDYMAEDVTVLAYCDSCGIEYQFDDSMPDKLGDAMWALCPDCITEQKLHNQITGGR